MLCMTLAVVLLLSSLAFASAEEEKVFNLVTSSNSIATKLDAVWVNRGDLFKTLVFRSLFLPDTTLTNLSPDLAASYTVSDDNLTVEVTLKDNIFWHDMEPITAEDVKWSIETALKAASLNAIYSTAFSNLEGAAEWTSGEAEEISGITIDGNVVTFQLARTSSTFLPILGQFAILPKHCLEDVDPLELHNDDFWQMPVGSGMYKVAEFNPGNYVVYERFEGYEGEAPQFDRMVLSAVGDYTIAASLGDVDYMISSNPDQINSLNEMEHMTQFPVPIYYYRYLVCNLGDGEGWVNEKIADPRIRRALLMAIDRENLLNALFAGLGNVANSGVPTTAAEYDATLDTYAYDPEAAKALLVEAGFDFNETIKLRYYAGDTASISLMEAIAYSWEEIGVKVDVAKFQGSSTEELFSIRDYDFSLKALSAFSYEEYYGEYTSTNNNFRKVLNAATDFDALVAELAATPDAEGRAEILSELQQLEQALLYKMPLGCFNVFIYVNTGKLDVSQAEFGNPYYNYDNHFATWDYVQ